MATYLLLFILPIFLATSVPTLSLAKEFIVGDEQGWKVGVDYSAWAEGKDFFVGDKLVFQYPVGAHNVYRLNGADFQNCTVPADKKPRASGNDTILLSYPGKKWYVCGVGQHCNLGQKLVITVKLPNVQPPFPSIAPSPWW